MITGQVEELAASLPPYEPGSLDWHEAVDRLLDQGQEGDRDPALDLDQTRRNRTKRTPRASGTITPEISGTGELATAWRPGRVIHQRVRPADLMPGMWKLAGPGPWGE